ncbi:MAG: cation:proton antiporter [Comamonadaceae bacterium]|nr:cation:proton antiporter [Comamonadaceae bacterium]
MLLAAIFLSAMTTYQLGIFAIFGGFMMGVILHDEHDVVEGLEASASATSSTVFFLPIFFTYTGLRTNVGGLDSALRPWGWCALLHGAGHARQIRRPATVAARWAGHVARARAR